jgi:hypothetical protein
MRHLAPQALILFALIQSNLAAEQTNPLPTLEAGELAANATATTGPNGQPAIQVTGGTGKTTTTVVNCPAPEISSHDYVVRGQVKYDGVADDGYLELWNDFGSKGKYFTRSLADWGSMRKLNGTSKWRAFELPFHADPGMRPENLTLNVVLPGAGTVIVAQPTITSIDTSSQWWSEQQAGLLGGLMGCLLGTLGAVVGYLASRGKAKQVTFGLFVFALVLGGISLTAGLVAVALHQPWHVYYLLLLGGIIDVAVFGGNFWSLLQRHRADELRRITALNA